MLKNKYIVLLMMWAVAWGSLYPAVALAQKKEIIVAKDQVKAGTNLDKAQQSMEKLLLDSVNRGNKKIWSVLYGAVKKQYEQGNEKLYLKQQYDTAKLFNLARQLFVVAERFDSVEMIPDKKGKVNIEFRKEHASYLNQIRPNLFNGGTWFVRKQKYLDAYRFFDQYIMSANSSLFQGYGYGQSDKFLPKAAYWAVYCGYKMKDAKATLHHSYEALKDTARYDYMLQYLAETYKLEKDTARYEQALKEGFGRAPKFPFFFPRLVDLYAERNQLDSAMVVVDRALAVDSANELYLLTKSTILLNLNKYKECADICDALLAKNDSLAEAYYNGGMAYFNMAVELDKNTQLLRKRHQEIQSYYQKALPYLERFRALEPLQQNKWSLPLYTIYLNLNKGKEFDEIDKLIRKTK